MHGMAYFMRQRGEVRTTEKADNKVAIVKALDLGSLVGLCAFTGADGLKREGVEVVRRAVPCPLFEGIRVYPNGSCVGS